MSKTSRYWASEGRKISGSSARESGLMHGHKSIHPSRGQRDIDSWGPRRLVVAHQSLYSIGILGEGPEAHHGESTPAIKYGVIFGPALRLAQAVCPAQPFLDGGKGCRVNVTRALFGWGRFFGLVCRG